MRALRQTQVLGGAVSHDSRAFTVDIDDDAACHAKVRAPADQLQFGHVSPWVRSGNTTLAERRLAQFANRPNMPMPDAASAAGAQTREHRSACQMSRAGPADNPGAKTRFAATLVGMKIHRCAALLVMGLISIAGCSQTSNDGSAKARETSGAMSEHVGMAEPAAAFAAHFTDPIYNDVSDDRTPFGSDEGADMLATWDARRAELGPDSTVEDVLGEDPLTFQDRDDWESLVAVQAAGFTLLRLTGQIDPEGKKATLKAIDSLISAWHGDAPELRRQRDDPLSWTD
jgi:hypothetical protein